MGLPIRKGWNGQWKRVVLKNAAEFEQWLIDQMDEGLVYLDWPLTNRLHVAAQQDDLTAL